MRPPCRVFIIAEELLPDHFAKSFVAQLQARSIRLGTLVAAPLQLTTPLFFSDKLSFTLTHMGVAISVAPPFYEDLGLNPLSVSSDHARRTDVTGSLCVQFIVPFAEVAG